MNKKSIIVMILVITRIFLYESSAIAQIHDIKSKSKENKSNHQSSSSDSNSSDDDNSGIGGCLSIMDIFSGCASAIPEGSEGNNTDDGFVIISDGDDSPFDDPNFNPNNVNNLADKNTKVDSAKLIEDQLINGPVKIDENNEKVVIQKNQQTKPKDSAEINNSDSVSFSIDFGINGAYGFESSSSKTYKYTCFMPEIRVNIGWFSADYRFNILTEQTEDVADAFKTWDLIFAFKLKPGINTALYIGTGMYDELFTDMLYNQHYLNFTSEINSKHDFVSVNGRLTVDYKTSELPYSEFGISFNKFILQSKNVSILFNVGGMYQNYHSTADIWSLKAGIRLSVY